MEATAKDLRFHSKELLETVLRGEEVIITYRGKPTAKLVPLNKGNGTSSEKSENELFGLWKDREDLNDVDKYIRKNREEKNSCP